MGLKTDDKTVTSDGAVTDASDVGERCLKNDVIEEKRRGTTTCEKREQVKSHCSGKRAGANGGKHHSAFR